MIDMPPPQPIVLETNDPDATNPFRGESFHLPGVEQTEAEPAVPAPAPTETEVLPAPENIVLAEHPYAINYEPVTTGFRVENGTMDVTSLSVTNNESAHNNPDGDNTELRILDGNGNPVAVINGFEDGSGSSVIDLSSRGISLPNGDYTLVLQPGQNGTSVGFQLNARQQVSATEPITMPTEPVTDPIPETVPVEAPLAEQGPGNIVHQGLAFIATPDQPANIVEVPCAVCPEGICERVGTTWSYLNSNTGQIEFAAIDTEGNFTNGLEAAVEGLEQLGSQCSNCVDNIRQVNGVRVPEGSVVYGVNFTPSQLWKTIAEYRGHATPLNSDLLVADMVHRQWDDLRRPRVGVYDLDPLIEKAEGISRAVTDALSAEDPTRVASTQDLLGSLRAVSR